MKLKKKIMIKVILIDVTIFFFFNFLNFFFLVKKRDSCNLKTNSLV
jgi:hypothetical protein